MAKIPHEEMTQEDLFRTAYAFQRSRIILTAFELRLFTQLADEPKTASEVAQSIEVPTRALERLMDALCALGLLAKKEGRYANAPAADRFLVEGRPDFMAGLGHAASLWHTWSTLTDAVKKGSAVGSREINDRGDRWLEPFIAAMHWRANRQAPAVAETLDLSEVTRVLDVGGGSGAFAMAFAKRKPGLAAVVFDLPNVVGLTKKYVEQAGLSGRVSTMTGNYLKDDLGEGYDLIFCSAVIHSNSTEENRLLVSKCHRALQPGGRIVIQDFVMDDQRVSPVVGAVFSLNMLVGTRDGDTYTESEIRGWLRDAGFSDAVRQGTPFDTSLIIAIK